MPEIIVASDQAIEGRPISFTGTVQDAGIGDTHEIEWIVMHNEKQVASGAGAAFTFTPGDDGDYTVRMTATDDDDGVGIASQRVFVANASPIAIDNEYNTNQGEIFTGNVITDASRNGRDSDAAGVNDPLRINGITMPGNGLLIWNESGSFTYTPDPMFSGTDGFTYTIQDDDGGISRRATVVITVAEAAAASSQLVPDTLLGGNAILIVGTPGHDHISVEPGPKLDELRININGTVRSMATPSGRILVIGGYGDDVIQMSSISQPLWAYGGLGKDRIVGGTASDRLDGGSGDDEIDGGAGDDLVFGGLGNDHLTGAAGNDVLVGGHGADRLVGSSGHDILIASEIASDFTDEMLRDVQNRWVHGRKTTDEIVHDLFDALLLDGSLDTLTGSSGADWFIIDERDKITDLNLKAKDADSRDKVN